MTSGSRSTSRASADRGPLVERAGLDDDAGAMPSSAALRTMDAIRAWAYCT
jgi:hypothetical protein